MLNLHRRDLVFPKDMHYDSMSLYVRIRDPKTARFARRQHGRIDDSGIIAFTSAIFGNLQLDEKLYPASATSFRKQWDLVMDSLQVPRRQSQRGATPGVLRGSGATYLYSSSEDINWVACPALELLNITFKKSLHSCWFTNYPLLHVPLFNLFLTHPLLCSGQLFLRSRMEGADEDTSFGFLVCGTEDAL